MREAVSMASYVEVTDAQREAARLRMEMDAEDGRPSRPGVVAIANAERDSEGRWMAKKVRPQAS